MKKLLKKEKRISTVRVSLQKKKNKDLRLVANFRHLNKYIVEKPFENP